jgi:hypothetical protein
MMAMKAVGEIVLTEADVRGLDNLLRYYRGKPGGGSTSHVFLLLEYYEGAKRVKVEMLEDGSGRLKIDEKDNLTDFSELKTRFYR